MSKTVQTKLRLFMLKILRHRALEFGLKVRGANEVYVGSLLSIINKNRDWKKAVTYSDIVLIARMHREQFDITDDNKYIRAIDGHSFNRN